MAKKNECYLCGGKLRDGYCPECGLDNTKIHGKHYHLNESYAVESMNGNTGRAGISAQKSLKIAGAVIGLAVVVTGWLGKSAFDHMKLFPGQGEQESETLYQDPYEYVEKELPETGEYYEVELGQGEYLSGVHFPEGNYTAGLLEGHGGLSVSDYENGIYLWQYFGTDEEYDEVEYMEDIRLYTGARLEISDTARLRLATENGQTGSMESIENPLTESFTLKKNKTMVVGEDIPSGVYDLHVMFNWAVLRCRIPDDTYEEGYYENSYWLGGEDWGDTYRNVYLKDGMEITAEENTLELTPSKEIGSGDYSDYYEYY